MRRTVPLLALVLLALGCAPALGPFELDPIQGRVVDEETGAPVANALVVVSYRGAGMLGGPQPVYHARLARTDADGRFALDRARVPSPRMWLLKTYGPHFAFYHPLYGYDESHWQLLPGAEKAADGEVDVLMRGSLLRSAEQLREVTPFCRGERRGPGAERLAELACPLEAQLLLPNGEVRAIGPLDASGQRVGVWTFHYDDGAVAARGAYFDGRPVDVWRFYARDGSLVRTHEIPRPQSGGSPSVAPVTFSG